MKLILLGGVGVAGPVAGASISLTNLEIGLRLVSLLVGIAVGLVTLWLMLKKLKRK